MKIKESIFSHYNGMKLEINTRKQLKTHSLIVKESNKKKITREITEYLKTNENKNTTNQNLQKQAKAILRKKFSGKYLHLKRKTSNQQLKFMPQRNRKRRIN